MRVDDDKRRLRARVRPLTAAAPARPARRTVEVPATDENEDWIKSVGWDFLRPDGTPMDTLAELEGVLGSAADSSVANDLLTLPFGRGAPSKLIEEARRAVGQD